MVGLNVSNVLAYIVPLPLIFVIPFDEPRVNVCAIEVPTFKFPVWVDNRLKSLVTTAD